MANSKEFSVTELIRLEEELNSLKKGQNLPQKKWIKIGDKLVKVLSDEDIKLNRKKYIKLAWTCGWFTGSHRFYKKQYKRGVLFILFAWTGIPAILTIFDLMEALPIKEDSEGNIIL